MVQYKQKYAIVFFFALQNDFKTIDQFARFSDERKKIKIHVLPKNDKR